MARLKLGELVDAELGGGNSGGGATLLLLLVEEVTKYSLFVKEFASEGGAGGL